MQATDKAGNLAVEDGLSHAAMSGQNPIWNVGTRLALVDLEHLHLDVHAGASGSLGWARTTTDEATAHALDSTAEIGWYLARNLDVRHRWRMIDAGLTLAAPIPVSGAFRLTPEVTLGYARMDGVATYVMSDEMRGLLGYANVDPSTLQTRFAMRKDTPIAHLGLRGDIDRRFSFDLAALRTPGGTYWMAASATIRFDGLWKT